MIGLDFDGVFIDCDDAWHGYYHDHDDEHGHVYPESVPTWDYWPSICMPCFDHVLHSAEIALSHTPRPGIVSALQILSSFTMISVVTAKPPEIEAATWNWLHFYQFLPYITNVIFTHEKRQVCEESGIKLLVDDAPKNIASLAGSSIIPVIYDAPYNTELQGLRVHDWAELAGVITTIQVRGNAMAEQQQRSMVQLQNFATSGALVRA